MAGVEQCIAAIGSALQGGAELMQVVQDRQNKKGLRQDDENELEQAFGRKMLYRALAESAEKCRHGSEERMYRFGNAFSVGDNIAMSELGLIMVNLQMQVISILQQAAGSAGVTLDVARLHEAVITAKSNTLRSMDELCQRIVYGRKVRQSESLRDFAHQNKSSYSIHDSIVNHRTPLESSKPRRHTMTGIAESHHQEVQVHPLPWPTTTTSTASSCRSLSTNSSISCRSSLSSPIQPPATPATTVGKPPVTPTPTCTKDKRQSSIPEVTPTLTSAYEPILRRKSIRSAFLRRPSKPTLNVHPAYREKLHTTTSTTALLAAERPERVWKPVTVAFNKVVGRVVGRCRRI